MSSYQHRKSHCGDKTVVRLSYLHNGISYTGNKTSLYWIRAQIQSKPYYMYYLIILYHLRFLKMRHHSHHNCPFWHNTLMKMLKSYSYVSSSKFHVGWLMTYTWLLSGNANAARFRACSIPMCSWLSNKSYLEDDMYITVMSQNTVQWQW